MSKLKATKIVFERAEGRPSECVAKTFTGPNLWEECETYVFRQRWTAPEQGGYDKCDVVITFEADATGDELSYKMRYDMTHPNAGGHGDTIAKHLRSLWLFYSFRKTPAHLTPGRHECVLKNLNVDIAQYARFCDTYEIPGM